MLDAGVNHGLDGAGGEAGAFNFADLRVGPEEGAVPRQVFDLVGGEDLGQADRGDCVVVGLFDVDAADFVLAGD